MIGKLETQDGKWYIRFDEKELKVDPDQQKVLQKYASHLHGEEVEFDLISDDECYALIDQNIIEWEIIFYDYRTSYRSHYLTLEKWLGKNYEYPISKL